MCFHVQSANLQNISQKKVFLYVKCCGSVPSGIAQFLFINVKNKTRNYVFFSNYFYVRESILTAKPGLQVASL